MFNENIPCLPVLLSCVPDGSVVTAGSCSWEGWVSRFTSQFFPHILQLLRLRGFKGFANVMLNFTFYDVHLMQFSLY